MNKIMTLLLLISTTIYAQQTPLPCATIETPQERANLMKLKPFLEKYTKSDEIIYIPIQFHNVANADGEGRWSKFNAIQNIADANEDYAPYNIQFYLYNTNINDINNNQLFDHDDFGASFQMNQNNFNNVVNVYVVQNPAGACGYYTYGPDAIMLNKDCAEIGATTLTHELGHYFGLPHPFSGWENDTTPNTNNIENVPRSGENANCETAGDSFCGTAPDYAADRWDCPYATLTDPLGNDFKPDETLYMSYSDDACQNRHSFDQVASVKAQIAVQRTYLTDHDSTEAENTDEVGQLYAIYPANNATVPATVTIEWTPVVGATHYALYAKDTSNETPVADVILTDTSYTFSNLENEDRIYWQVRPFHQGNYNGTPMTERRFNVSTDQTLTVDTYQFSHPSCYNEADASLSFEATGGTQPYTYLWDNGTEGNSIANVPYGKYNCTVTDANGTENILEFAIDQPAELAADVLIDFNNSIALVSGGTAPFSYQWTTSEETSKTATNLQAGENTLIITDANGCEATTDFILIKPNVVSSNVICYGDENGSLLIYGAEGGAGNYTYEWENGSSDLIRQNMGAGQYFLTVTDSDGNSSIGSYIISEADAPFEVESTQNDNDIILTKSGGVEPVTFLWSDGSTDNIRFNLSSGEYTVFVTDANGCTVTKNFTIYPTNNDMINTTTPILNAFFTSKNQLIVNSNLRNTQFDLQLFDIQGKSILKDKFINNTQQYNMVNLSSGVYFLQVVVNEQLHTFKLVKQ